MNWKTHLIGGITLGLATALVTNAPNPIPITLISAGAALLPDLDVPTSKITKLGNMKGSLTDKLLYPTRLITYPISKLLNKLFGHRGFIHSPLLWLGITYLLYYFQIPIWLWLGILTGSMSHLLLDSLNPGGIPWLWPYKKKFHAPITVKADNQAANIAFSLFCILGCGGASAYLILEHFL